MTGGTICASLKLRFSIKRRFLLPGIGITIPPNVGVFPSGAATSVGAIDVWGQ